MGKLSAFLFVGMLICMTAAQSTVQEGLKTFVASKLRKAPLKSPFSSSQYSDSLSIEDFSSSIFSGISARIGRIHEAVGDANAHVKLLKKFLEKHRVEESELELIGLNDVDDSSIEFPFLDDARIFPMMIKNLTTRFAPIEYSTLTPNKLAEMVNNFTNNTLKALSDDEDSTELAKESDLELFGLKNIAVDNNIINKQSDIELFIKRELPMGRASHNKSHGTRNQSIVDTKEKGKTQKWHELFLAKKPKVKDDDTPVGFITRKVKSVGTTNF